jgi:hypothetical protein
MNVDRPGTGTRRSDERWGLRRTLALLVVLATHLAVLASLVTPSRTGRLAPSTMNYVEVMALAPVHLPKLRTESVRPRRLSGNRTATITAPVRESLAAQVSAAPSSSPNGSGSGVDWTAEARRALRAYEIRQHQPPSGYSVSSEPVEDNWWPQAQRHVGAKFKTANGDWIVWIDDSCYQLAGSESSASTRGATLPRTICPDKTAAVTP